jgi:hypothetical protein
MRMTMKPIDIAHHLVEDVGFNQAYHDCRYRKTTYPNDITYQLLDRTLLIMSHLSPSERRA